MAFSISGIDKSECHTAGGVRIIVSGSFEGGNRYRVHIGSSTGAPPCNSGKPGQGTVVYPSNGNTWLDVYTPLLKTGVYDVHVVNLDTSESHDLVAPLTVRPRDYQTETFSFKKLMPPDWRTGARSISEVS